MRNLPCHAFRSVGAAVALPPRDLTAFRPEKGGGRYNCRPNEIPLFPPYTKATTSDDFSVPETCMQRSFLQRLWYQLLQRPLQLVAVLAYGVRYWGRENIPGSGGVLVVSNHQSHFDPPLVGIGCPRRLNYVARDTLFGFAPFGWLIHSVGAIPIDREGMGLGGIKESLKRLKRGEMVLIFPEGTRTRRRRGRALPPRFHHLGGPLRRGHLARGHRGRVSGLAALAEISRPGQRSGPLRCAHPAGRVRRLRRTGAAGGSRASRARVPRLAEKQRCVGWVEQR